MKQIPSVRTLLCCALSAATLAPAGLSRATGFIWTGVVNDQWNGFAFPLSNWQPALIPSASDTVTFTGTTPNNTITLVQDRQVQSALVTGGGAFTFVDRRLETTFDFQINGGGSLSLGNTAGIWSAGNLTIDNGFLDSDNGSLGSSASVYVGDVAIPGSIDRDFTVSSSTIQATSGGIVLIRNNATVDTGKDAVLGDDAGEFGSAIVSNNGQWDVARNMYVGRGGSGTLTLQSGGSVTNFDGLLGLDNGSNAIVAVVGGGAWTNTNAIVVGVSGTADVSLQSGGTVNTVRGFVGRNASANGTVDVTGTGSAWDNTNDIVIGESGTGILNIESGGSVSSTDSYIGKFAGSSGAASVTGTGSTWNNTRNLVLGGTESSNGGTASLTLEGDAAVFVGDAAETGFGSRLIISDNDPSGTSGGHLYVRNGATLTNDTNMAVLGDDAGEHGFATVTGAGTRWINANNNALTNNLVVGDAGSGTLAIAEGAEVTVSDTVFLAFDGTASRGTVSVTGPQSKLLANGLSVGFDGTGSLEITGGGEARINAPFARIANNNGSSGTVTVSGVGSALHITGDGLPTKDLFVGNGTNRIGTLTVQDGGIVRNAFAAIATGSSATVMSGATWTNTDSLTVGSSGAAQLSVVDAGSVHVGDAAQGGAPVGSLTISDADNTTGQGIGGNFHVIAGSSVNTTNTIIGDQGGEYGYARLEVAGSTWNNADNLSVGRGGRGFLTIEGGTLTNALAFIGQTSTGNGTVRVTGADALWRNTGGGLRVAENNVGTLNIENGGTVESTLTTIGTFTGAEGEVTVTGVGSRLDNSGNLEVGTFGSGLLTIDQSAVVTNQNAFLGHLNDAGPGVSFGRATVINGGTWISSGNLVVGGNTSAPGGFAQLIVRDQGRIEADGFWVWDTGSVIVDTTTQIEVTSNARLGGNLLLFPIDANALALGDQFTILTSSALNGTTFDEIFDVNTVPGKSLAVTYANEDVTITVALPADTNLDGDIDDADIGTIISKFTGPTGSLGGRTWVDGDTSGDGDIDDADVGTAIANFTGPVAQVKVPEPTTLAMLALGAVACSRRRRG